MARAFAIFGNQGKEVEPIAVLSVEDKNERSSFINNIDKYYINNTLPNRHDQIEIDNR